MKLVAALAFLAFLGTAAAMCPNSCSGHGTCGANDACSCYGNWQGSDCSARVCAFGLSWVDTPGAINAGHAYSECSSKGICDRKSGQCKCFDGYEGKACRRSTCPNDCSGHGTCEYINELGASYELSGNVAANSYALWDANKIQGCSCDRYWSGYDCSERQCPKGDDPLTVGQVSQVQTIDISQTAATAVTSGQFVLTFTDLYGGVWNTRPITPGFHLTTADEGNKVRDALTNLPNHVIGSVTVAAVASVTGVAGGLADKGQAYTVTFSSAHNSGQQNAMTINCAGCTAAGCQPKFAGIVLADATGTLNCAVAITTPGTEESTACSNRGTCDSTTGVCECFEGYTDENCSEQSALV